MRFTFGSIFMKKRILFQVCFFFDFVMLFERGRRRRGPPPNSRILKKLVAVSSRPAPLKGCGEFIGCASAADLWDSRIRGMEASRLDAWRPNAWRPNA